MTPEPLRLTDAERWELLCWDERVKNAQMVLSVCEAERDRARQRILIAHDVDPLTPVTVGNDGSVSVVGES